MRARGWTGMGDRWTADGGLRARGLRTYAQPLTSGPLLTIHRAHSTLAADLGLAWARTASNCAQELALEILTFLVLEWAVLRLVVSGRAGGGGGARRLGGRVLDCSGV